MPPLFILKKKLSSSTKVVKKMTSQLGVGRFTQYCQASNYGTIYNHSYRDPVPYNASKQIKMKCPSCGVWARKGAPCNLCSAFIPSVKPRAVSPNASLRDPRTALSRTAIHKVPAARRPQELDVLPVSFNSNAATTPIARRTLTHPSLQTPRNNYPVSVPSSSAIAQRTSPFMATASTSKKNKEREPTHAEQGCVKVQCRYCGLWVVQGRYCSLCRTLSGE